MSKTILTLWNTPPKPKYLDERFMGDEINQIKIYWETRDMKTLENWWVKE